MTEEFTNYSRRTALRILGATAVSTTFAGCLGDSEEDTDTTGTSDERYVDSAPDYGGWFDDVSNYSGTVDKRGQDDVIVLVGAGDRGLAFAPPAVIVSPDTTIVWEWTDDGGTHNVVAQSSEFESEYSSSDGYTFEYTFDSEGVYKYFCEPHRAAGMKGAVTVEPQEGGA